MAPNTASQADPLPGALVPPAAAHTSKHPPEHPPDHPPVRLQPPDISRWAESSGMPYVRELLAQGAYDALAPAPDVLLTALVHGNEYSGAHALDALLRSGLVPQCGRITVAFCNVAAFARFDATAPDRSRFVDEDFNRVWGARLSAEAAGHGAAHGAPQAAADLSVELRRAREIAPLVERASHLLDLHSMHEPSGALLLTGLLPRNLAFARAMRSRAQLVIDAGHSDGVRMRDHAGLGAPDNARIALLLEAGQHWDPASEAMARDTVMRFLVQCGSIDATQVPPGWLLAGSESVAASPAVEVTHRLVAKTLDFTFAARYQGGEVIAQQGSVIAHDGGQAITTPYDDCVLVMPSLRQLRVGVTTLRLGRLVS